MCFSWFKQKNKATGVVPQSFDSRDFKLEAGLPQEIEVSLRGKMASISDQGSLNACTAYAIGSLFDYVARYKKEYPWISTFDFSEAYQWYMNRYMEGNPTQNAGVQLRNSFKTIMKYGFTDSSKWDFKNGWNAYPSEEATMSADFFKLYLSQFKGYYAIEIGYIDTVKTCIQDGYPVVFAFPVTRDFMSKTSLFTVESVDKSKVVGYHAMLITGYGKTVGFEIRNSWGTGWGDKGYCFITEQAMKENAFDYWTLR